MHQTAADWNSNFAKCTTAQQELPYFEYAGPLDQSPTDQREHKLIRLPNNMVVVCTRDSDTTKAAAYLSVNVGSFADPPELHGMAHFLEHMLFMGSKKYPDTNEMDLYTGQNMGGTNALTSYENTTYELTVANSALEGGLNRFAQLFISPLFNPANVDQEINNIDSEFKGVLNKDGCRMLALKRLMVDPNHPYSKFNYGNISTLKESAQELGLNLRDEVVRFYEQHYSADIMKLAIVGNHPMDVLIEWAVSKFSAVKSKGNTRLPRMESPLAKDVMGNLVQYQCIGATSELYVQFATPDMQEHYQTYPCMYLQMLVKLNGPGSLMHYLKQKEWATSITVPAREYSGFSETPIALKLTPKGLEHYQDVLQALFAYIHMLQQAGAQEWFFEELQSVASLSHKYYKKPQEKDWADLMSYGSHNPHIPPEHYLTKRRLLQKFDPEAITKLLNSLTPQNCQVFLGAQNQSGVKYDGKEKIFGTLYHISKLPFEVLTCMHQEWQEKYQFRMPKPNRFICKNIPIYSNPDMCSEVQTPPTLLQINDKHEVWFKQSDQISNPYGSIHLQIQMPNGANVSPMDYLVTQILNSCFSNIISKELEDAKLAGINHSVKYYIANMCVSADGFSEMLPRLTESLIKLIMTTKLDENTYNSGKAAAKKALQDAYYSSPYLQLYDSRSNVFRNKSWPAAVLEEALANVEIDMVQDYLNHVFDQGYFKLLVCGNFKECHALEMASMIGDHLQMKPMLKEEYKPTCLLNFEPGQYIHCQEAKNEKEANNALFSTIYGGSMFNLKDKVAVALIQKILSSEFFDQLRTKEQIGYVANAYGVNYKGGKTTISCVIQSEQNPVYLSQRVTKFMNDFGQNIQEFPESKLSKMVQLAISERRIGYKTVLEEAKAVWNQIDDNDYNFAMREQENACLQEITKEYIIQVWNRCINPNTASELTRVDMQIWSKALGMPSTNTMESYPEGIIALHGCLEKDGVTGFSLEDLHQLLKDRSVGDVEAIFSKIVVEGAKTTKVKSALEMALQANKPGLVSQKRPGLLQTADGKWIITKLEEFKASQKLHELPDPITPLIPKYE